MAIVNIDDRYGQQLLDRLDKNVAVITYGMGLRADFRASNYRAEFTGTSYQLDARGKSYLVRLPLIGRFNVTNSIAALAAAEALGINLRERGPESWESRRKSRDAWNWFLRNDNFRCSWITHTRPTRSATF